MHDKNTQNQLSDSLQKEDSSDGASLPSTSSRRSWLPTCMLSFSRTYLCNCRIFWVDRLSMLTSAEVGDLPSQIMLATSNMQDCGILLIYSANCFFSMRVTGWDSAGSLKRDSWGLGVGFFFFLGISWAGEGACVAVDREGSAMILRQYCSKSEVIFQNQWLCLLNSKLFWIILLTSAWNCDGVAQLLPFKFFSIVCKSIGSLTISRQFGIPKAIGSTGSRNGHEVLWFLSKCKTLKHGFMISSTYSQYPWLAARLQVGMPYPSSAYRVALLVFLMRQEVSSIQVLLWGGSLRGTTLFFLVARLVLISRSCWKAWNAGRSLASAWAWARVRVTVNLAESGLLGVRSLRLSRRGWEGCSSMAIIQGVNCSPNFISNQFKPAWILVGHNRNTFRATPGYSSRSTSSPDPAAPAAPEGSPNPARSARTTA